MIRAKLLKDGKTVEVKGEGTTDQILQETKYLLRNIRESLRGACRKDMQYAGELFGFYGLLTMEVANTRDELLQLAETTDDPVLPGSVHRTLAELGKLEGMSAGDMIDYMKEAVEQTRKKLDQERKKREKAMTEAEDRMKKRILGEEE